MLVDTHCHLNFDRYDDDREAVIQRAAEAGVTRVINPGTSLETSRAAVELHRQYGSIYAAVGIHPNDTAAFSPAMLDDVRALAAENGIVAIGEIGLDYYWDKSPKDIQAQAFRAQLDLAAELELPVIIHNREAGEDVMKILEDWVQTLPDSLKERPGVLHSFSAPQSIAERALHAGFYLGFTGPVTFKKADDLRQTAASIPLDRILIETDGPFLTPHPYRGKRNEPAYVTYIADRLAALHHITEAEMARITTENAERLFKLPAE